MKNLIVVRGGGDIATGTIYKLKKCGFSVLIIGDCASICNPQKCGIQ